MSSTTSSDTNPHQESPKSTTSTFVKTIFFFVEAALAINGIALFSLFGMALLLDLNPTEVTLSYLPFAGISLVPIIGGIVTKGSWRNLWHAFLHSLVIAGLVHNILSLPNLGIPAYVGITNVQLVLSGFVFKVFRHLEGGVDGKSNDKILEALCSCFGYMGNKAEEVELEQQRAVEEGRIHGYLLCEPPSYEMPRMKDPEKIGAERQALLKDMDPI